MIRLRAYMIDGKHTLLALFYWFLISSAVLLTFFTVAGLLLSWLSVFLSQPQMNALDHVPLPLSYLIIALGVYTGVGAVVLWVAMWVYWMALERSRFSVRAAWFFELLLLMHYGALIYAIAVLKAGRIRRATSHRAVAEGTM